MVAIAVVGGMLVFVFSQDFFTQTDSMTGPTIEVLQIFGYDARDLATASNALRNAGGATCTGPVGVAGGTMADGDVFAVYLRNLGSNDAIVQNVSVYNVKGSASAIANFGSTLAAGTWTVMTNSTSCANSIPLSANSIIKPGTDATVFIGYNVGSTATDFSENAVKSGRPLFVKVETSSGSIFPKQLTNGRSVG